MPLSIAAQIESDWACFNVTYWFHASWQTSQIVISTPPKYAEHTSTAAAIGWWNNVLTWICPGTIQRRKQLLRIFASKQIRWWIINQTHAKHGLKKCDISMSERCSRFFWQFICYWTSSKWGVLVHKNSLAPCQVLSSQHRATRSDMSPTWYYYPSLAMISKNFVVDIKWAGHRSAHVIAHGWSTASKT